jgi:hypothetical protein
MTLLASRKLLSMILAIFADGGNMLVDMPTA